MDRSEYKSFVEKKSSEHRQRENTAAIVQLIKSSVSMQNLTGSMEWNSYLEMVNGFIEKLVPTRDALNKKICSGDVVDHNEILSLKLKYIDVMARIETLEQLSNLPKQIIEAAKHQK